MTMFYSKHSKIRIMRFCGELKLCFLFSLDSFSLWVHVHLILPSFFQSRTTLATPSMSPQQLLLLLRLPLPLQWHHITTKNNFERIVFQPIIFRSIPFQFRFHFQHNNFINMDGKLQTFRCKSSWKNTCRVYFISI